MPYSAAKDIKCSEVSISGYINHKCSVLPECKTSGESPRNCLQSIFLKLEGCLWGGVQGVGGLMCRVISFSSNCIIRMSWI